LVVILLFFIYEGFRESKQLGPIQGRFRIKDLKWEEESISVIKSIILSTMFFVGILGAWSLTLWGRQMVSMDALSPVLFAIWFIGIVFCVVMMLLAYSRWLMFGALVGYWLAWVLGSLRASNPDGDGKDSAPPEIRTPHG
jgi:hypothetical protein